MESATLRPRSLVPWLVTMTLQCGGVDTGESKFDGAPDDTLATVDGAIADGALSAHDASNPSDGVVPLDSDLRDTREDVRTADSTATDDATDALLPDGGSCIASAHFGRNGELWSATGPLIDHGYAGYHAGRDPLPEVTGTVHSVVDYGATPDDTTDDTQAFLDAISATKAGIVWVPQGRFIVTQRLTIGNGHVVLRGAGRGQSVLALPKSLGDVYGLSFNSAGQSNWSFGGGFLTLRGSDNGAVLTAIDTAAKRGDRTLHVASTAGLQVGQWVRVLLEDKAGNLLSALHEGYFPGNVAEDAGKKVSPLHSKVERIDANTVTLERPLPMDLDVAFAPKLAAMAPTVTESGIEHLTLEFAGTPYPGHFKEHGYNGIELAGVSDCWVRDVEIQNADYGITVNGSRFVTVADVVLDAPFNRGPLVGHHGLNSSGGTDLLFTRFDVRKTFVHDLTVDGYAFATVFSDGKGVDLNMDHHGRAPYGTLWTRLDLGAGTRPFASGGSSNRMPHSGAFSTFWNLTAKKDLALPATDFGPLLRFIGVRTAATSVDAKSGWLLERIEPASLCPADLHLGMRALHY